MDSIMDDILKSFLGFRETPYKTMADDDISLRALAKHTQKAKKIHQNSLPIGVEESSFSYTCCPSWI